MRFRDYISLEMHTFSLGLLSFPGAFTFFSFWTGLLIWLGFLEVFAVCRSLSHGFRSQDDSIWFANAQAAILLLAACALLLRLAWRSVMV